MDLLCQKEVEWSGSMYQIFIQSNFNFGKFHNYTYTFRINFQFEYITILISYLFSNYEILKRIRTIHRHTSKMKEVRQETTIRVRLLLISLWFRSVMWQTMFHDRSVKCRIWAVKTEVCVFLFYIMNIVLHVFWFSFWSIASPQLVEAPRRSRKVSSNSLNSSFGWGRNREDLQRPLTRYLPIDNDELDLRQHIESAGEFLIISLFFNYRQ